MELTTLKDYYLTKVFPPTQRGGVWDAEAGPRGSKS
jgi:hypothetical protein